MFSGKQFPVKQRLDPWYVTGLCESSASFTYSRSGRGLAVYFAMKLKAPEAPILHRVQAAFGGVGRIYGVKPRLSEANPVATTYFRVAKARELVNIVAHFERFPLIGSKARAFVLWRQLVTLKQRFRRPHFDELQSLAQALSAANRPRRHQ